VALVATGPAPPAGVSFKALNPPSCYRARHEKSHRQPLERVQLAADLQSGPEKTLGHPTALWTLPRVVALIGKRFGHRYSTAQASRLLRQMGWSCQQPARRALERDEQAIRVWKQRRWPAI
jgi:transposase